MILAHLELPIYACATLYIPWIGLGFGWNGVNHSTYARCSEGGVGLNSCPAVVAVIVKMTQT